MMQKIILASQSAQRKKLMKLFGFPYQVMPSKAEELQQVKTTCAALVKDNALLKAQEVAGRIKEGLVIGSDTVVYLGNKKIMGKPKNLKEARDNLKVLFKNPQWVYSGVAVIDAQTNKTMVAYEKTRVFMTHLSDEEIDRYYAKMSPLDKAGGFDIEGWGSIFISRVEGCYTNVIGLPMARLALMLKEFGVEVL